MQRNVTLRMDEELLNKLRHRAVDARMSLSAWITRQLEELLPPDEATAEARTRSLARMRRGLSLGGERVSREELHAR